LDKDRPQIGQGLTANLLKNPREKGIRPVGHRSVTVWSFVVFLFVFNRNKLYPGWVGK
jgi:hypothetical protein